MTVVPFYLWSVIVPSWKEQHKLVSKCFPALAEISVLLREALLFAFWGQGKQILEGALLMVFREGLEALRPSKGPRALLAVLPVY